MQKSIKPASFLMASRGRLLWFQNEVNSIVSLDDKTCSSLGLWPQWKLSDEFIISLGKFKCMMFLIRAKTSMSIVCSLSQNAVSLRLWFTLPMWRLALKKADRMIMMSVNVQFVLRCMQSNFLQPFAYFRHAFISRCFHVLLSNSCWTYRLVDG